MDSYIEISLARRIAEITKAIYNTIAKYDLTENRELLFDMSLMAIVEACNYNLEKNTSINNLYAYASTITEGLIFQYFPEKRNSVKAGEQNEEEH
ncbi:MAG: hypothetical protein ACI4U0_04970 [Candidatus Aphodocola sp.]